MTAAPNTAELVAVYQHIKAHPDEWSQSSWAYASACGTTYCFAGWTVVRAGEALDWYAIHEGNHATNIVGVRNGLEEEGSIFTTARDLLGLTHEQAFVLFCDTYTLDDIRRAIVKFTGVDPELVTS